MYTYDINKTSPSCSCSVTKEPSPIALFCFVLFCDYRFSFGVRHCFNASVIVPENTQLWSVKKIPNKWDAVCPGVPLNTGATDSQQPGWVNVGVWAIIHEVSILQRGSAAVACLWRELGSRALQGMAQGIIELLRSLLSSKQYFMCGKALWASWGEHRMTPGQQPLHKEQLHDET